MKKQLVSICLAVSVFISGCATIVGDKTQTIPISSTPSEANIVIMDENNVQVFEGLTPSNVTLEKSDGSYWGKKSFTVTISKEGYESQVVPITASANGWYIGGNLIVGGLIGWFIVDPLNGAMYKLSPEQIGSDLGERTAHNNAATDGSIAVMLIQDVPQSLRSKMTRIN